jgi:hypothetical protein
MAYELEVGDSINREEIQSTKIKYTLEAYGHDSDDSDAGCNPDELVVLVTCSYTSTIYSEAKKLMKNWKDEYGRRISMIRLYKYRTFFNESGSEIGRQELAFNDASPINIESGWVEDVEEIYED